jgi:hypothetical protein
LPMRDGVASCPPTEHSGSSHAKDGARGPLSRLHERNTTAAPARLRGACALPAASGAPAGRSTRLREERPGARCPVTADHCPHA